MNEQQIFDKVLTHLRTQGRRAMNTTDSATFCAYRGANGTKCAVGAVLSDKYYRKSMEGKSILELLHDNYRLPLWMRDARVLLAELQEIHDRPEHWDEYGFNSDGEEEMRHCAWNLGLKYREPGKDA